MDTRLTARRKMLHDAHREGRRRQHVEEATERTPEERLAVAARLVAFIAAVEQEHGRPNPSSAPPPEPWLAIRERHRRLLAAPARTAGDPAARTGA